MHSLHQLADCQTYVKTIVHIRLHSPSVIFVPDTFMSSDTTTASRRPSPLLECLREEFEDVPFEQVPRKCWNDAAGLDFVTQLILNDEERPGTLLALANKYVAQATPMHVVCFTLVMLFQILRAICCFGPVQLCGHQTQLHLCDAVPPYKISWRRRYSMRLKYRHIADG